MGDRELVPHANRDTNVACNQPRFAVRRAGDSYRGAHGSAGGSAREGTRARSARV